MNNDKINTKNIGDIGYRTLFSGDAYLMLVYKKSHGISRATYLISDFFDDKEPIKIKMRALACELMELVLSLSTELSPERKRLLDNIIKSGLNLISYSEIAMFSGIESQMNHSVLTTEILALISIIEEREMPSRLGRHFVLDEAFFAKDTNNELVQSRPAVKYNSSPTGFRNINKKESTPNNTDASDQRKLERRSSILAVVKSKGAPSIKDISDVVKDCSEKTIQRELLDMVANGLLKKEGERRWSRYSVV